MVTLSVLTIVLTIIVAFLCGIYLSFKNTYRIWRRYNIPYLPPSFPFGNFRDSFKNIHFGFICQNLYEKLKSQGDYAGIFIFKKPTLLVLKPEFAKTILVRDFNSFMNRGLYFNPKDDPLSVNLFFNENNEWKQLRQKLTPAFTTGKIKIMFVTLQEVVNLLVTHINENIDKHFDIKELMECFTTDVVSSCIFGIESNSLKNPQSDFRENGRKLMAFSKRQSLLQFIGMSFRTQARALGLRVFSRESTEFFNQIVHKTIGFRKENNIHRNDLMQIMIELMRQDYESNIGLTIDEVAANAAIFFFAGFETSSTTLTFALYNLATHMDIQEEARKEVNNVISKHDGKMTYDCLSDFDLVERILLETLRLYPPVATLHRVSNRPYRLPNDAEIPEGTFVIVPVYGIHHDPDIYPEPEKFNPNRFTNEEKAKRHPYAYLPFGEGPRICIGLRFAMMQTQALLAGLLRNFRIELCPECDIPPKIDNSSLTFLPCDGSIWLKFEKI